MTGPAHDPDAPASGQGRLLVASPTLLDPNFQRSVLIMLEHNDEGALGLVLNRPLEVLVSDALPDPLSDLCGSEDVVFQGGPVQPEAVILLAEFRDPKEAASLIVGDVGVVDPDGDPAALRAAVHMARAFGGYAGWGAGQLESEIAEGAWIDVAPRAEDIFHHEPGALWRIALDRKGGRFRLFARMPADPSLN